MVYQESSTDILYWDAFERLCFHPENLKPFKGSFVGFLGEHVQVKGYLSLRFMFEEQDHAKEIKVSI